MINLKLRPHVILTQIKIKEGLKTFSEKVNYALINELRQVHDKQEACLAQLERESKTTSKQFAKTDH